MKLNLEILYKQYVFYPQAAERGHQEACDVLLKENPALRTIKDRRSRAPHDLVTDHPTLKEHLQPRKLT